nr:hypothetical protein [Tanacetum cinerariifolium]
MRLVTHGLEECDFENTCNNDKNLSEIQLEHEKEDELVVVVVKVAHELDCRMVVREIEDELLEEMEVSHFRKEVMILDFDTVSGHFDFMPCGATTLTKHVVMVRYVILDEQNPRCLEDWENLDYQDLVVDDWVDGNGLNPGGGFEKSRGGQDTRGGGDGLEGPDVQLSMV